MNITETLMAQADTLKRLYSDERKTTIEIGKIFGCSQHPVQVALRRLGIKRNPQTKGTKPTKEQLEQWVLVENRTYADIAQELNCDPSAIGHWLKGYGIYQSRTVWTGRNAKRQIVEPTKKEFEALYIDQELSLEQIGQLYGATRIWAVNRMKSFGIPIRPGGWGHKVFVAKDGHKVKSVYEKRVDDWLYEHGILHEYEPLTPFNNRSHADFRVGDTYIEIWGVADNEIYKERQAYKLEQYTTRNIPLISINFWDFDKTRNRLWERKLEVFLR